MISKERMSKGIRILGLGRCVVGHLNKNLVACFSHLRAEQHALSFRHNYVLNLLPCLISDRSQLAAVQIPSSCRFAPTLEDQVYSLDELDHFDVLVIEIFPAAPVYEHSRFNIYACFENYTKELADHGFRLFSIPERNRAGALQYAEHLADLVKRANAANPEIKIILLNGEFAADSEGGSIGNPFMLDLMREVRANRNLANDSIELIDAISLLNGLSERNIAFHETEFPYLYIRHTKELEAMGIARDCKHASPFLRRAILKEFCRHLRNWGFSLTEPGMIEEESRPPLQSSYRDRAHAFLERNKAGRSLFEAGNARVLSNYLEYSSIIDSGLSSAELKQHIRCFLEQQPQEAADLKSFLYHVRSLSVYMYAAQDPDFLPLCQQVIDKILCLPAKGLREHYNFAILWITNLILASNQIIDHNPVLPKRFLADQGSLLDDVACHSVLNTFSSVQCVVEAGRRRLTRSADHSFRGAEHDALA